jgi:hypothetical protein
MFSHFRDTLVSMTSTELQLQEFVVLSMCHWVGVFFATMWMDPFGFRLRGGCDTLCVRYIRGFTGYATDQLTLDMIVLWLGFYFEGRNMAVLFYLLLWLGFFFRSNFTS